MVLWITLAGLTAAALIAVLWPFLRANRPQAEAADYDAAVFRDQIEEIDSEQERELITDSEAEAARTEVSRRLLATAKSGKNKKAGKKGQENGDPIPAFPLVCAFLFVPVACTGLYLVYGSPGLPDRPLAARLDSSIDGRKVGELVARVEARLREHPQDGRGWEVIAPVYMRQRRYNDAADAFGKALRLQGETPRRLVEYGNALVLANDGVVIEQARKVLQRALSQDESLVRAHFWLAVAQEQDGQYATAAAAWRDLLKRSAPDAPWREAVQQRLAAVERQAHSGNEPKPDTQSAQTTKQGAAKGPTQEDIAAAQDLSAGDRSAMIRQMVAGLAERLETDGGSVDEWKRLVRSYTVLGNREGATAALRKARKALSGQPEALASLSELADTLGLNEKP